MYFATHAYVYTKKTGAMQDHRREPHERHLSFDIAYCACDTLGRKQYCGGVSLGERGLRASLRGRPTTRGFRRSRSARARRSLRCAQSRGVHVTGSWPFMWPRCGPESAVSSHSRPGGLAALTWSSAGALLPTFPGARPCRRPWGGLLSAVVPPLAGRNDGQRRSSGAKQGEARLE